MDCLRGNKSRTRKLTQPVDIATQKIFDTCACSATRLGGTVLIAASNPGLGLPLLERLQLTPGIQGILLAQGADVTHIASEMDYSPGFSLAWIQPVKPDLDYISSLLHHPALRQIIVLEASWLGRRILPLWNTLPKRSLATTSQVHWLLQSELGWFQKKVRIGNLSSLWWGFLGGRIQGLGRPDLEDRCFAHMRCHLSLSAVQEYPVYLTLTLIFRRDLGVSVPGNVSDTRQV
jgi:hypothetical protein